MSRRTIVLFAWSLLAAVATAKPQTLVLLHTNDIHGHFAAERADWRKDGALVGGFAELSRRLDSYRSKYENTLYLDAGDLMTGNPICDIEYRGVRGGALLEMLRMVDVDVTCLGNHEFDLGADHLRDFTRLSPIPIICANVLDKETGRTIVPASRTIDVGGIKVGVIGLVLDDLHTVVARHCIEPFDIAPCIVTAQKHINELDPVTDVIILLTHCGVEQDKKIARGVRGADVIVGGHSHTRLNQPLQENGVLIVQAGSYCKNLGILELHIESDSIVAYQGRLEEMVYDTAAERTELSKFSDSIEVAIQARYGQVIGELAEPWTRGYYQGSIVGNWICDKLRVRYQADVALVNTGGLRTNWSPGPITKLNVLELLPFENSVVEFTVTGADLLKIAHEQADAQANEKHGILEMSGMEIEYKKSGKHIEMVEARVASETVQPERTYRIATIDYVAISQATHYFGFTPSGIVSTGELLSAVITEEIQKSEQPLRGDSTRRLREIK